MSPARTFPDWPGWARVTSYVAVLVALTMVAAAVAVVVVVRRPLAQVEGTIGIAGLSGKVEVLRDDHGIPQIYADTSEDLFVAQGFVQAQDRFFQMDYSRRASAGRISELIGASGVRADMAERTMGWRRVAAAEYDLVSLETRSHLQAFSDGVNAYLRGRSQTEISLEYTLLGLGGLDYKPEAWTPVDSLTWLKATAWDLNGTMDEEVQRARLSVNRTPEQVSELYPRFAYDRFSPIVTDTFGVRPRVAPSFSVDPAPLGRDNGVGANSWVVSGRHTVSGKPLLANDPHLQATVPGPWYQVGLHCRSLSEDCPFDVSGFSFAGMPGVMVGHNTRIAWGLSSLDPDVSDLYLESVLGHAYLYDGKRLPLAERDEVIRVRGGSSRVFTVRSTEHGPLLSDVSPELSSVGANAEVPSGAPYRGNGYAVALAWTALRPRPTADAIFALDRATDWTEFREAARKFDVPSQNLVYADTEGNIGYQAAGWIPVRPNDGAASPGAYPVAGWLPENDWSGKFVPFEKLPSVYNPPSGVIVAANQAVTGPDYPYQLAGSPDHGYRSQRARDLLERSITEGDRLDVNDATALQLDSRNPMAPVLVPYLKRQLLTSRYYADGQRLLADWDYAQPADSAAAAYFNVVWSNLLRLTFHDQLPESLWPDGGQRWMAVVSNLLRRPNSPWWDDSSTDGVIEDRDSVLNQAMRDARDELTRRLGVAPSRWAWGRLHRLELSNPAVGDSEGSLLARVLDRGPYDVAGGNAALDASSWDAAKGYSVTSPPVMRMVVDLDDLDRSRWVSLAGASGHVWSDHYGDQTPLWVAGRTLTWASTREAVAEATKDRLLLIPGR
ncbi:MAG: penicillin acylase family protein [Marmoricola sp.]